MGIEMLVANLTAHWIQAGVLVTAAVCALHLVRVKDPRFTLVTLHKTLLLIVLLPWVQPWLQPGQTRETSVVMAPSRTTTTASVKFLTGPVVISGPPSVAPARPHEVRDVIILCVIATGVGLRLGWLLLGMIRLRRFAGETRSIEAPEFAADVEARVRAVAEYREHPSAWSPSTFGIFKPRVVLPARFASLPPAHQLGALCHELIHVRRRDVAVALAEELLTAALWFHPWVWVLRRRIRVAREQVVDLQVLALTGNRGEYVRCLIEMSGHDLVPHLSQARAAMVRSHELRARVDAMFQEVRMSRSRLVAASMALTVMLGTAAWAAARQAPLHAMDLQTVPAVIALDRIEKAPPAVTGAQTVTVRPSVPTSSTVTSSAAFGKIAPAAQATPQPGAPGQMRRLIKVAYADYPSEALDKHISGTVKITIVVNAAGDVTVADVTSGPVELRSSAFKAAMGLKYSPGADTARINIAVEYRLDLQGWGVRVLQDSGTTLASSSSLQVPAANPGGAVRVGGNVPPPKKTKDLSPVYPAAAREARVQGVVIMEATIDEAGNVSDVRVLRSVPLLDQAAIDAVKQWQYTPTLLDGVPVPVLMTVTVNFTLRIDPNVTLNIGLPTGGIATIRVMDQAGVGTLDLPNVGKFGFTPIRGVSPTGRSVHIYEVGEPGSPLKLLGTVQVELNGGVVQSPTTPSFGVELAEIP